MKMISYDKFSMLRMADFWPVGTNIRKSWGIEGRIGFSEGQSVGFCHFLWPPSHSGMVSEIRLEAFGADDCPIDVATTLFRTIGLPVLVGMSTEAAIRVLGKPMSTNLGAGHNTHMEFRVGEEWVYRVRLMFTLNEGLQLCIIVREDMYVPD